MRESPFESAAQRLRRMAAESHAFQAQLAAEVALFDTSKQGSGDGLRSCAHWLTINAGMDEHNAAELIRVGHAMAVLPWLRAAFENGELSLDKMRALTKIATPADEDVWLNLARAASGQQLVRICRAAMRALRTNESHEQQVQQRGMWAHWQADGMLELRALLPAEDGALVVAAIEAAVPHTGTPPDDGAAALRADALILIAGQPQASGELSPAQVVVHVDVEALTGSDGEARCGLEDGPPLADSVIQRLGCDADLVTVVERNGNPLHVGRSRRLVSGKLRQAMRMRDRGCRFPGCAVPARYTHGHHIKHWIHGGHTDLNNVLSLCGFHHRRLHDGKFSIYLDEQSQPHFVSTRGQEIGAPQATSRIDRCRPRHLRPKLGSPAASDNGGPLDLGYAVGVVLDACEQRQRSLPGP